MMMTPFYVCLFVCCHLLAATAAVVCHSSSFNVSRILLIICLICVEENINITRENPKILYCYKYQTVFCLLLCISYLHYIYFSLGECTGDMRQNTQKKIDNEML